MLLAARTAQALEVGQKAPEFTLTGPGARVVGVSPIFRYARRAYFVIDREGVVRYKKIQANALDLLKPEEVLQAFKDSGAK